MSSVKKKRDKAAKSAPLERLCKIIRDLLDILVSLYMVVLTVILPLYTTEPGYR